MILLPLVLTIEVTYQTTTIATFFFLFLYFYYLQDIQSTHCLIASLITNHVENALALFFLCLERTNWTENSWT